MPVTDETPTTGRGSLILVRRQQSGHLRFNGMPQQMLRARSENLRQRILNSLW